MIKIKPNKMTITLDGGPNNPVPIQTAHRVRLIADNGVALSIFVNEDGHLVIQGDDRLVVLPRAANAIHLEKP